MVFFRFSGSEGMFLVNSGLGKWVIKLNDFLFGSSVACWSFFTTTPPGFQKIPTDRWSVRCASARFRFHQLLPLPASFALRQWPWQLVDEEETKDEVMTCHLQHSVFV